MQILIHLLVTALALFLAELLIPGISVSGLYTALIVAALLGILNVVVRPVLIILTLPINIITLGLFTFVINAGIFWFVASFVDGFVVSGFIPALLGSIFVSIVSMIGGKIFRTES